MLSRSPRLLGALLAAASGLVVAGVAVLPVPSVHAAAKHNVLFPTPGSTGVPIDTELLIKFDEVMKAENANISVWKVNFQVTSATTAAQIKANSSKIEEFNVDQNSKWDITKDPPVPPKVNMGDKRVDGTSRQPASEAARYVRITIKKLEANVSYFIRIDSGAFTTASTGEAYGIESETTWLFTTGTGSTGGSVATTVPGATTTTTTSAPAVACPGITFPGRAPRQRIDAAQTQFTSKALACSISLITRSKLIAVAVAGTGTLANPTVTSYTVKATRIGGSFLTKPVTPVAGPSVQRTQFTPLKTGSWTVTVTALGPTGAVVAEWTSAAFPVRP